MRRLALLMVLVMTGVACTSSAPAGSPTQTPPTPPTPIASPSPRGAPSASPSPEAAPAVPRFRARNALEVIEALVALGPRETTSVTYRRASALVAGRFEQLGYDVRFQDFDVPQGSVDGVAAPAGRTRNVVAEPPGFDPRAPHLVVGGHLDSVPDSPGANDNASGIGVMVELARLARGHPPRLPVVFVAFAAEERRRQTRTRSDTFLGALTYLAEQDRARARALRGMLNLDMVGNGDEVLVLGERGGPITAALLASARRLTIPARPTTISFGYSDHQAFVDAGIPVGWLWAGDHPSLHTPRDTIDVIQPVQLRRIGRVAWETLRTLRLS